jgi:ribosomal protein L11 methyltransferase
MKKYKEFKIALSPFDIELVSGFFWDFDITGLIEEDDVVTVYADEKTSLSMEKISAYLNNLKKEKAIAHFTIDEKLIPEKNWNLEWEKKRRIIRVSNKIVIKPSFKNYKKKRGEIVLTIDPKMSFGTGEHSSTKLMLKLIEQYVTKNDRVLDIGTGTGILSIASIKLGAIKAIAVDNDEWSYKNCIENCMVNKVRDKVKVRLGEVNTVKEKNFDMVLTNIQKNIILELVPTIKNKVKKEGVVLLSGLLIEDEEDVLNEYAKYGFKLMKMKKEKEWLALSLTPGSSGLLS